MRLSTFQKARAFRGSRHEHEARSMKRPRTVDPLPHANCICLQFLLMMEHQTSVSTDFMCLIPSVFVCIKQAKKSTQGAAVALSKGDTEEIGSGCKVRPNRDFGVSVGESGSSLLLGFPSGSCFCCAESRRWEFGERDGGWQRFQLLG